MRISRHLPDLGYVSRIAWTLTAALAILVPGVLSAQATATGAVTGRVSDARSQQPVLGATVSVDGTLIGGATGADGRYRLTGVPVGARTVSVRRIGIDRKSVV